MGIASDIAVNFSVVLILFCGVFITLFLGGFQFRYFLVSIIEVVGGAFRKGEKGKVSSFGAVATALAGTIGVGNIAGVCTAIATGGVGALFWIWVAAFFGMAVKFSEIVLAVKYRVSINGAFRAGPMFYIERGLKSRKGAVLFSLFTLLASFGIGNLAQSNTAAVIISESLNISIIAVSIALTAVAGYLLFGGVKRVIAINCFVVPIISALYIICCLIIIYQNRTSVPTVLREVMSSAFSFESTVGGSCFLAVRYGVSRGIFSNEAGLGSSPIIHGEAECENGVRQGMWGIFEVFFDTIFICSLTAVATISSGGFLDGATGISAARNAFVLTFGPIGGDLLAISMTFFALSSICGWSVYGERAAEYLGGKRFVFGYRLMFSAAVFSGAFIEVTRVFMISEILNALMSTVNLFAVLFLVREVKALIKDEI